MAANRILKERKAKMLQWWKDMMTAKLDDEISTKEKIEGRMEKLLSYGADPNGRSYKIENGQMKVEKSFYSFLMKCIDYMDIEGVRILLKAGANISIQNEWNREPMHMAIARGNVELLELLIEYKGNINLPYQEKSSALSVISDSSDGYILKLAEKGLNMSQQHGAIHNLTKRDYSDSLIIKLIEDYAVPWNDYDEDGNTTMHTAANENRITIMECLHKKDPQLITKRNRQGRMPLEEAAKKGRSEAAIWLIEHGAMTDTDEAYLEGLGIHTVESKNKNTIKKLNEIVPWQDKHRELMLEAAIQGNNPTAVQALLELGTRTDIREQSGKTILWTAAQAKELHGANKANMISFLLDQGIKVGSPEESARIAAACGSTACAC